MMAEARGSRGGGGGEGEQSRSQEAVKARGRTRRVEASRGTKEAAVRSFSCALGLTSVGPAQQQANSVLRSSQSHTLALITSSPPAPSTHSRCRLPPPLLTHAATCLLNDVTATTAVRSSGGEAQVLRLGHSTRGACSAALVPQPRLRQAAAPLPRSIAPYSALVSRPRPLRPNPAASPPLPSMPIRGKAQRQASIKRLGGLGGRLGNTEDLSFQHCIRARFRVCPVTAAHPASCTLVD